MQTLYSVQDIIAIILAVCGGISVIGGAVVWGAKAFGFIRRPELEQDEKIADHEKRIRELESKANRDYEQIQTMTNEMRILMKGTYALLRHAIDGNDTESLKQAERDIIQFLNNK